MNSTPFGPNEHEVTQHLEPQESPQHPLNFPAGVSPTHLEKSGALTVIGKNSDKAQRPLVPSFPHRNRLSPREEPVHAMPRSSITLPRCCK